MGTEGGGWWEGRSRRKEGRGGTGKRWKGGGGLEGGRRAEEETNHGRDRDRLARDEGASRIFPEENTR